jgi:hypothetical protein
VSYFSTEESFYEAPGTEEVQIVLSLAEPMNLMEVVATVTGAMQVQVTLFKDGNELIALVRNPDGQ